MSRELAGALSHYRSMARLILTPSTAPVVPAPSPLLLFIQRAQLALVYSSR